MKNILADKGRNRMKEKTIEDLMAKLVHMCGLGKIIAEVMKRPGVHENFARAEKIEGILENSDIYDIHCICPFPKKL